MIVQINKLSHFYHSYTIATESVGIKQYMYDACTYIHSPQGYGWYYCVCIIGTESSSFNAVPTLVVGDINEHLVTRIYTGANTSFAITGNSNNNNNNK